MSESEVPLYWSSQPFGGRRQPQVEMLTRPSILFYCFIYDVCLWACVPLCGWATGAILLTEGPELSRPVPPGTWCPVMSYSQGPISS